MARLLSADRAAPIVAGVAGLMWFWAELAPQRYGFEDTDNPATGLRFLAAHPEAWAQGGLALGVAAIALVATVIAIHDRLESSAPPNASSVGVRTVAVLGILAAAMLLGMAVVRLAGGPLLHVQGLGQDWGEGAYLVTQFVGIQLFAVGGLTLLSAWILGVGWIGGRRAAVPRLTAMLAVLPGIRVLGLPGTVGILPDALWIVLMASVPASFLWLVLLGARQASARGAERMARSPNTSPATV
jgi:hypothetical protein